MSNTDIETFIAQPSSVETDIADLNSGKATIYSSINADTFEGRVASLKAVTNSTPLRDAIGVPFNLKDVIVQPVDIADEKTGELNTVARVILITDKGDAHHGVSDGLMRSVKNIIGLVGEPSTWDKPIKVVAREERGRVGTYFTLNLA